MKVCPPPRFLNGQNETLHHILLVYATHRTQVMSAILISLREVQDLALLSTGFIDIRPLFPGGVQTALSQLVLLWSKQAVNQKRNGQVVLVCVMLTRLPVDGFSSELVTYSPNPGPVTKCYKCEKPVKKNQLSLNCSAYYNLYHVNCTDRKQISKSANLGTWTCSCCLWSTLSFNHVRSDCLDHQATETSIDNLLDCHQNALTANNSHLSIMHLNTQCMTSTFAEFTVLINSYDSYFDIITLDETWLKDNPLLLQHISVPGYQLCYNNRNVCKGGGVGAYIKDSIVFKRRKDIENLQREFEHMWLEIPGKNKNSKLLLGVLYRSTRILNSNDWIEKFEDLLSNIVPTWEGMFVMTGDMNINMFKVSDPLVS